MAADSTERAQKLLPSQESAEPNPPSRSVVASARGSTPNASLKWADDPPENKDAPESTGARALPDRGAAGSGYQGRHVTSMAHMHLLRKASLLPQPLPEPIPQGR